VNSIHDYLFLLNVPNAKSDFDDCLKHVRSLKKEALALLAE